MSAAAIAIFKFAGVTAAETDCTLSGVVVTVVPTTTDCASRRRRAVSSVIDVIFTSASSISRAFATPDMYAFCFTSLNSARLIRIVAENVNDTVLGTTGVLVGRKGNGVLMGRKGNGVLGIMYRIGTGVLVGREGNVVLEIVYRIGTGVVVLLSGRCLQSFLSPEPSTENFPVGHGLHLVEALPMEYVSIGQGSHI